MREVQRVLAQAGDNQLEAARAGLDRLVDDGLIPTVDQKRVGQICAHVFASQKAQASPQDAASRIRVIYDQMLVDAKTSPVALAIASIASSGSSPELPPDIDLPEKALEKIGRSDKVDIGIVGGAIVGGAIGGAIGGVGGAIIGGVVGGIAGGVGTACAV